MNRTNLFDHLLHDFAALHRALGVKGLPRSKGSAITGAQCAGLFLLVDKPSYTVKEVATVLGITSSAATQMLDGLVAGGYALRSTGTDDRRVVVIKLSEKGKKTVSAMRERLHERTRSLFSRFSDAELTQYCMLTSKLVKQS